MYLKLLVIVTVLIYLLYIQSYVISGMWGIGAIAYLYWTRTRKTKRKIKTIDVIS